MFDNPEKLFILTLIALFIFGPQKLIGLGGAMGRAFRDFRGAVRDAHDQFRTAVDEAQRSAEAGMTHDVPALPAPDPMTPTFSESQAASPVVEVPAGEGAGLDPTPVETEVPPTGPADSRAHDLEAPILLLPSRLRRPCWSLCRNRCSGKLSATRPAQLSRAWAETDRANYRVKTGSFPSEIICGFSYPPSSWSTAARATISAPICVSNSSQARRLPPVLTTSSTTATLLPRSRSASLPSSTSVCGAAVVIDFTFTVKGRFIYPFTLFRKTT